MPELPEVETVVRYLRPKITGQRIVQFTAHWPKVTLPDSPSHFANRVERLDILEVTRRGKYIILVMNTGIITIHLRMTGHVLLQPKIDVLPRHTTADLLLSGGIRLVLKDTRKFGRIGYFPALDQLDKKLGVEPLSSEFTPAMLEELLSVRRRQMKPLLLDQSIIAGLGNIYVDEALFTAGIHPTTVAADVSPKKMAKLHDAIQNILRKSIAAQGTTFLTFGFGESEKGTFSRQLRIFGRNGEACPECGTGVVKSRVGQRGTYFCPQCQPIVSGIQ